MPYMFNIATAARDATRTGAPPVQASGIERTRTTDGAPRTSPALRLYLSSTTHQPYLGQQPLRRRRRRPMASRPADYRAVSTATEGCMLTLVIVIGVILLLHVVPQVLAHIVSRLMAVL